MSQTFKKIVYFKKNCPFHEIKTIYSIPSILKKKVIKKKTFHEINSKVSHPVIFFITANNLMI